MNKAEIEQNVSASELAINHFRTLLDLETDCWDVHEAMATGGQDFVLVDVRSSQAFSQAHIPGALSLPHKQINAASLAAFPKQTLFVVYCAGPHCNGADKAGLALAQLGRPVKKMIGGVVGWRDEGFEFSQGRSEQLAGLTL